MPSVDLVSARSSETDAIRAAEDICNQFGVVKPKLVTVFAARSYDHHALNRALRERLPPETRLFGATTAGEIDRQGMHTGSVVAGAFSGDFEVGIGLGHGLSRDAATAGEKAIRSAAQQLGVRADDLASRKHVAVVIDDGFRNKKEELLLGVMAMNQALVAVGGGASDTEWDFAKQSALVHVDGEVATDAALVALFKTEAPWSALRSHWYSPSGKLLTLTKVDETAKRALEIDGKPAAMRYAEILGVEVDDLAFLKPKGFAAHPLALRVGREHFIRSPLMPLEDGSILFANTLEEGSELEIVDLTNMAESTRRFFEHELPNRVQNVRAAMLFHCNGRAVFSQVSGTREALSDTFRLAPPCVGFNVQFETYCGFHINNTLTSLVFGAST